MIRLGKPSGKREKPCCWRIAGGGGGLLGGSLEEEEDHWRSRTAGGGGPLEDCWRRRTAEGGGGLLENCWRRTAGGGGPLGGPLEEEDCWRRTTGGGGLLGGLMEDRWEDDWEGKVTRALLRDEVGFYYYKYHRKPQERFEFVCFAYFLKILYLFVSLVCVF